MTTCTDVDDDIVLLHWNLCWLLQFVWKEYTHEANDSSNIIVADRMSHLAIGSGIIDEGGIA